MTELLAQPALVLNSGWTPLATTSVRTALTMLYRGHARAVCPDTYEAHDFDSWADLAAAEHEPVVRTARFSIRVPEVVQLVFFNKVPPRRVAFTRKNLYRRDKYTCQYCGATPGSSELSIDHIVPRSRGGRTTWLNCVIACVSCNRRKGNQSVKGARMALRRSVREPRLTGLIEIPVGARRRTWEQFVSEAYWNTELRDDA